MQRRNIFFTTIFCASIIFALAGCQTTAKLTKKEALEDSNITNQVEARLQAQPVLGDYPISVETYDGDVTLTGQVATENQKARAVAIAKSVAGVKRVYDLLKPFEGVEH